MPVLSPNEIEVTAKRAVRGAGFAWGLAEELAKAVRWLECRSLPGLAVLAGHLRAVDGRDPQLMAIIVDPESWHATVGSLSPITAGPAVSDAAEAIVRSGGLVLASVAAPLLLAPFAAAVACATGRAVQLSWPGAWFAFSNHEAGSQGGSDAFCRGTPVDVHIAVAGTLLSGGFLTPSPAGVAVDPAVAALLAPFVHRTYVPASEQSRSKGAGAGNIDND